MTLELHETDDARHPINEILLLHDDFAEPVKLTGDDTVLGCAGYV